MLATLIRGTFISILLLLGNHAVAQTTATPPAAPDATAGSDTNWLWILIVVALLAAAVWYFTRKRGSRTNI
jgi:LPXTG-motif cell wall-anchored protein